MSDPKTVTCGRCQEENDVDSDDEEFVRCVGCSYIIPLKPNHTSCPVCQTKRKKLRNGGLANFCKKCGYEFSEG